MKRCLVAHLAALVLTSSALAQTSPVPTSARQPAAGALRATLVVLVAPQILLNGQADRLAPGARIYGLSHTTVMPAALQGQTWQVQYLRDSSGLVYEVWLLDSSTFSGRNFRFEAEGPHRTDDGQTPYHQLPRYQDE